MSNDDVSLDIYNEGIVLRKEESQIFVHFNDEENGDPRYIITKDFDKYVNKQRVLNSIHLPLVIGILKIQYGHLICVSHKSTLVSIANLEINRVEKTVLVPLTFKLAMTFFENWANKEELLRSQDSKEEVTANEDVEPISISETTESTMENDDIDLELTSQEDSSLTTSNDSNNENILFTKIGILAQSFKTSPMLGLNAYQKTNLSLDHELFDVERSETDIKRIKDSITFNGESGQLHSGKGVNDKKHVSSKFMRKLLRNVIRYFDKGGFYYSYGVNIIDNFEYNNGVFTPSLAYPMSAKSSFFWNRDLIIDFLKIMEKTDKLLVVPLIQGFADSIEMENIIGMGKKLPLDEHKSDTTAADHDDTVEVIKTKPFSMDFNKFVNNIKTNFAKKTVVEQTPGIDDIKARILLLSKRSNKRCGVRYLRRGIDDDANVANFIQTTQMLIIEEKNIATNYKIIRGSIPLFFEQDPSKLQPQPKLSRSENQSEKVLLKHYQRLFKRYNDITTISLIEKKKKEQYLGEAFHRLMVGNHLKFVWFDFHEVCKNMKFGKVKLLLDEPVENDSIKVSDQLDLYGWLDNEGFNQNGVFRINCIDCLDRTNIICKFINEEILNRQLRRFQLENKDPRFEFKFSNMWANNGDLISQQYCSTNAMKGDFTRTNKRNYKGLINDAILSLTRYYYNSVTDFFNQFIIDYLLYHNDNDMNFLENFESLMDNFDPNLNSLNNLQKQLIMASVVKMFSDETVLGSWWVKSSFELNKFKKDQLNLQFQFNDLLDCILISAKTGILLVYVNLDKNVLEYYQIANDVISELQYGHYFTSIFTANDKNPKKNIGLKIGFNNYTKCDNEIISNIENDSISIELAVKLDKNGAAIDSLKSEMTPKTNFLAIKFVGLPYNDCKNAIRLISSVCYRGRLVKKDLVTFEDAKKSSSIFKNIDHQVKKFIWG